MIVHPLRIGERGFVLAETNRAFFSLPQPAGSAHAVLQSLYVRRQDDEDINVRRLEVSLQTIFDPLQSATEGAVDVEIRLAGPTGFTDLTPSTSIEADLHILVIGT